MASEPHPFAKTLGHYALVREVGRGGMATVYEAKDIKLGRVVALKILHAHLRNQPEACSRFYREAQSIARLSHPNIITVYEYGGESEPDSSAYIAEEFLTGPNLRQWVCEHGPLPPEVVAAVGWVIADALREAHDQGIVHRDVKPENLMLHRNPQTTIKLTDFGIAHMRDAMQMTMTGQMLGSPAHMAPEQIDTGRCDARSDLFSLGTVLYFLSTGHLPFEGTNPHHIIKKILNGEYTDPVSWSAEIGGHLADIMNKLMAVKPEERFADARALQTALGTWLALYGVNTAHDLLTDYFRNPDAIKKTLAQSAVSVALREAIRAKKNKSVRDAVHHFNRLLAYAPNHPLAIKELKSMGSTPSPKRLVYLATAAFFAITTALWLVFKSASKPKGQATVRAFETKANKPHTLPQVTLSESSAPTPSASLTPALSVRANASKKSPGNIKRAHKQNESQKQDEPISTPRWVRLRPFPLNVTIAVDGGDARAFGPSFLGLWLTPGDHLFRVEGAQGCCNALEEKKTIPAGSGAFELPITLELRPASLYVTSKVPADVVVESPDGSPISGRTRSVLSIPMERHLSNLVTVTVSAPGHRSHKQNIEIRAGQLKELSVQLEAN